MNSKDALVYQLKTAQELFENFIKDFSEEDAHFQPGSTGNHVCWILTHLAVSADQMAGTLDGQGMKLPQELHDQFGGNSKCLKDDGMTMEQAWKHFTTTNERAITCIQNLTEESFGQPNPTGSKMFPTIGTLVALLAAHPYWHFGQLTVNRTLLGKPRVF
ncbi:MAG: hypothetical protein HJJLKODD_02085 [Phycisphaerae bacterium]|nr:hypothetical protein [Phycisphaerae bacterium]